MSSCVCKILFKSEQICGCCCKMLRGSLFWDTRYNTERKCAGTVPVLWAGHFQCWNINIFSSKIYGSNFIKRHSETVMVWSYQNGDFSFRKKTFYCVIYYNYPQTFVSCQFSSVRKFDVRALFGRKSPCTSVPDHADKLCGSTVSPVLDGKGPATVHCCGRRHVLNRTKLVDLVISCYTVAPYYWIIRPRRCVHRKRIIIKPDFTSKHQRAKWLIFQAHWFKYTQDRCTVA